MSTRPFFRRLSRVLAAALFLCLIPTIVFALPRDESQLTPAVSVPLPPRGDPALEYRALAARLSGLGLDTGQIRALWARMGAALEGQLADGTISRQDLDYLLLPHSRQALLARYQACAQANPELSLEAVVTQVNIGLDGDFYTQVQTVANPDDPLVLVNKYNALPDGYVPELVPLSGLGSGSLAPLAAQGFGEMAAAAWSEGISLRSVSAYRSYATQASLYRSYVSQYGQRTSDNFSARAGYSEHQTGLALDINVASTRAHFENTPAYAWLVAHCADYGFILRYPQGKEAITGYRFEPWHYRYVGVEIARLCMEQGLTYEEYLANQPIPLSNQAPALFWNGTRLEPEGGALMLEGEPYVSAAGLARALGWVVTQGADALTLEHGGRLLTVAADCRCQLNGVVLRLTAPALELDGALYLPLDDLCTAMGLNVLSTPAGLSLVHRGSTPQSTLVQAPAERRLSTLI